MAETQSKRLREEESHEPEGAFELEDSTSKRQKSNDNKCSILEEEPEAIEPNQDLLEIYSALEQEISPAAAAATFELDPLLCTSSEAEQDLHPATTATFSGDGECSPKEEEDDIIKVIRHLLEASDDELGIPNTNTKVDEKINSGNYNAFEASFDGFWELEDEAANYYTMLQSELFM
ncbi:Hypothetical predicted protein [Olea europaea subsp. europaea]|uniref:Uncharacterized protein n=1 Tax=Olea europaea subsp. europaea TaxID=158383 RepID=A0A8S0P7X2_OLEEU|nr:Hypothetical predicted protein [Olea europaea subsp. europaea]